MSQTPDFLNDASHGEASKLLGRCCGSSRWIREMVALRPFATTEKLQDAARQVDDTLNRNDWIEAFSHHHRIGDRHLLRTHVAGWSADEQGEIDADDDELLDALARASHEYERKFGFIFLIFAPGVSGREVLTSLNERLANDRESEWKIAADEQRKFTQLRLTRLVEEHKA